MKKIIMLAYLGLAIGMVHAQQGDIEQGAMQEAESALGAVSQNGEKGIKGLMQVTPKKNMKKTPAQLSAERKARMNTAQTVMIDAMFKEPKPGFWQMTGLLPGELAFLKQQQGPGMKRERKESNAVYGTIERVKGEAAGVEKEYVTGAKNIEKRVGATEAAALGMKKPEQRRQGGPDLFTSVRNMTAQPLPGKSETLEKTADAMTTQDDRVSGVNWKRTAQSSGIPPVAIRGGFHHSTFQDKEMILSNFICRIKADGSWQVGTLTSGGICLVPHQEKLFAYQQYQVLQGAAGQLAWKPNTEAAQNIVAVGEDKKSEGICHALIEQNIPHGNQGVENARDVYVGHVVGKACVFGANGREQSTLHYEVLTKK